MALIQGDLAEPAVECVIADWVENEPPGRHLHTGDKTVMSVRLFGMSFGTGEIVLFAFVVIVITMYFMQKSR